MKIQIIFEDDDLLVVNKPSGISVTKDRSGQKQLLDFLASQMGQEKADRLRLIHRLDKQTSGVLLLAKNLPTQSMLSSFFAKRQVKKIYLALTEPSFGKQKGNINAKIKGDNKKPGMMQIATKKGKSASTHWQRLADFNIASLVAVYPVTGRTHQIRLHLPDAGMPLLIDPLYGNTKPFYLSSVKQNYTLGKYKTEKPLIDVLTLHAYQLTYRDPENDTEMTYVAPLHKDFKAALKMITKHNPNGLEAFEYPRHFEEIIEGEPLSEIAI